MLVRRLTWKNTQNSSYVFPKMTGHIITLKLHFIWNLRCGLITQFLLTLGPKQIELVEDCIALCMFCVHKCPVCVDNGHINCLNDHWAVGNTHFVDDIVKYVGRRWLTASQHIMIRHQRHNLVFIYDNINLTTSSKRRRCFFVCFFL